MLRTTLLIAAMLAPAHPSPPPAPADAASELSRLLADWAYPGHALLSGSSGGGGNSLVEAMQGGSAMTTDHPVGEVAGYYSKKLGLVGDQGARAEARDGGFAASSVQDDSSDRPVDLKIITWRQGGASGTIVVSWAEGEPLTHIALSISLVKVRRP